LKAARVTTPLIPLCFNIDRLILKKLRILEYIQLEGKIEPDVCKRSNFLYYFCSLQAFTCEISDLVDNIDGKHGKLNKYFEA
jgi:hypothetical protein